MTCTPAELTAYRSAPTPASQPANGREIFASLIARGEKLEYEEWKMLGECRNYPPDVFFSSDGSGLVDAKKICAQCMVRSECLEYALDNRINHGVWGGASERERARILRRRRANN